MRAGKYESGALVLRAKIDMASPNFVMRDPVMYRILKEPHPRTGNNWCIYPMYDFAHSLSDSIEKITHSICTLEFENNRALYDWFLIAAKAYRPQQIEFARLNLNYTVMSKRKLLTLVKNHHVFAWDDPRMPTISGLRRRGYTPSAIRDFCERIGVAKANSMVDISLLEHCLREDLNKKAPRAMVVVNPVKLTITNLPENFEELLDAENNPEDQEAGMRKMAFSPQLFIERDDFMMDPPKDYFRFALGREVRLKHAYYLTCPGFEQDEESGEIKNILCTYDPKSKGGWTDDGRKVRGTIHWVSRQHAVNITVRLYDRLFKSEAPEAGDFLDDLNPNSVVVQTGCKAEAALRIAQVGDSYQFLRHGYFVVDEDSKGNELIFNRAVSLKDSWSRQQKK
jgi:glutaminyl-tRNA synthetase